MVGKGRATRPAHQSRPRAARREPATARIGDDKNGFITFVNKSRADLCTPERIAYEQAFLAWLDGGEQGDPPPEPASSQQGVKDVQFTQRTAPAATTSPSRALTCRSSGSWKATRTGSTAPPPTAPVQRSSPPAQPSWRQRPTRAERDGYRAHSLAASDGPHRCIEVWVDAAAGSTEPP